MTDNNNDFGLEYTDDKTEQKPKLDLATNLFKSDNPLDLNSMMQLATSLLKNETLMHSVTDRMKQKPTQKVSSENENSETVEITKELKKITENIHLLFQKLEIIKTDLDEIKQEQRKNQNRFTKFISRFKK